MLDNPAPLFLVAGVDVDAPATPEGRSIMDLFAEGKIAPGAYDIDRPYESLMEWVDGEKDVRVGGALQWERPHGLRSFVGRWPAGARGKWQVLIGVSLAAIEPDEQNAVSVPLADAKAALQRVHSLLTAWGIHARVGLYGIWSE